jgi:hypothetical protein
MKTAFLISSRANVAYAKANEGEKAPPAPTAGAVTEHLPNANLPATAPLFEGNDRPVVLNGKAFVAKQITRSVIPQRDGQTIFVQITGKPYEGKPLKEGKTDMAPATLIDVTDLATGELGLLIVNKVLAGQLDELYPNSGFIGRNFAVTMKPKADGKRYKTFVVYELEATA